MKISHFNSIWSITWCALFNLDLFQCTAVPLMSRNGIFLKLKNGVQCAFFEILICKGYASSRIAQRMDNFISIWLCSNWVVKIFILYFKKHIKRTIGFIWHLIFGDFRPFLALKSLLIKDFSSITRRCANFLIKRWVGGSYFHATVETLLSEAHLCRLYRNITIGTQ